jgi:predicted exporter
MPGPPSCRCAPPRRVPRPSRSTRGGSARRWPRRICPQARFLDLKDQADRLYAGYLREALWLSLTGLLVIALLLWVALGSALATLRVLLPLVLAILVAAAAWSSRGSA